MMRSRLILAVLTFSVLAVLLFGRDTVSYLAGARQWASRRARDKIPAEVEIARTEWMLGQLDGTIEDRRRALVRTEVEAERLHEDVRQRHERLARDEAVLRRAAELLARPLESYVIAGRTYTRQEVESDAQAKARRLAQDRDLLQARERLLAKVTAAIPVARESIAKAGTDRQLLASQTDSLRLRAEQLATLRTLVTPDPLRAPSSSLARVQSTVDKLSLRLEVEERLLAADAAPTGIDYHADATTGTGPSQNPHRRSDIEHPRFLVSDRRF
jgi:septal ring factor EnvC (AmiA/AmiB activator)